MNVHPRRLGVSMAALVAVCAFGPANVTAARAATVISCAGISTFDIGNSLTTAGGVGGTWTASGDCGVIDTAGLPFGAFSFGPVGPNSSSYTYSGNCVEGTMSFTGGGVAHFVAGLFVLEAQANGRAAEWVGALIPSSAATVCKGTPGTTLTWSGPSQGNGV